MLAEIVGSVENDRFEIEDALDNQLGARPMPFPGMDSMKKRLCCRYRCYVLFLCVIMCLCVALL